MVVGPDNGLVHPNLFFPSSPSFSLTTHSISNPSDLIFSPPWLVLFSQLMFTIDILCRILCAWNTGPPSLLLPRTKMELPLPLDPLPYPFLHPRRPPLRRPHPPWPTSYPRRQTLPPKCPPRLKLPHQHRPLRKTLWLPLSLPRNLVPSTILTRTMFRDHVSQSEYAVNTPGTWISGYDSDLASRSGYGVVFATEEVQGFESELGG